MRRSRRILIPQRRRVFVGCEGESESSYAALLGRLIEERHRRVHLDIVSLRGGDPLAIVETAIRTIRRRADRRGSYSARAIFLDDDAPERHIQATALAMRSNIQLIWQTPCHEALLLRHLPECERLQPPSPQDAMTELRRRWPDYRKATPAARLATRLDREAVLRAASVEAALSAFLETIEFDGDAE